MAQYRIDGQVYEANSPQEAYKKAGRNADGSKVQQQPEFMKNRSDWDNFAAGMGRGMYNVGRNIGNMVGLVSDEEMARAKELDQALLNTGAGQFGNFVGETALTAPIGGGVATGVARVGSKVPALVNTMNALNKTGAGRVAGRSAGYGAEGAVEGAILADPNNRWQGAGEGAAWGAGAGNVMDAGAKAIQGARGSDAAQRLLADGVDLTPGQMNPNGWMQAVEESAVGKFNPAVQGARETAVHQTVEAMADRARPPAIPRPDGTPTPVRPKITGNSIREVTQKLYDEFDEAYKQVKGYDADAAGLGTHFGYFADRTVGITDDVRKAEKEWLLNESSRLHAPNAKTDNLLEVRSNIRARIRDKYKRGETDILPMLERAENEVTRRINEALPNDKTKQFLADTDAAYSKYKIIEDLSYRSGDAAPTPYKISQSIKQAESSKGSYARGAHDLSEFGEDVSKTFMTRTPYTGMANFVPAASAATAMFMGAPYAVGTLAPALTTAVLSGTKTGRKFYRGDLKPQKALQKALDALGLKPQIGATVRAGAVSANDED